MEPKIALFFLLIASVIGLSHLNDEVVGRMRRQTRRGPLARNFAAPAQSLGNLRLLQSAAFFRRA